jgi:hypothetical protein
VGELATGKSAFNRGIPDGWKDFDDGESVGFFERIEPFW